VTENRLQYASSNREIDVSNSGIDRVFCVLCGDMCLLRVLRYNIFIIFSTT